MTLFVLQSPPTVGGKTRATLRRGCTALRLNPAITLTRATRAASLKTSITGPSLSGGNADHLLWENDNLGALGAGQAASAQGLAFLNPNGTIGFGMGSGTSISAATLTAIFIAGQ